MNQADHYRRAEELVEQAMERISSTVREPREALRRAARDDAHTLLRAALVHATLATAPGPDVADQAAGHDGGVLAARVVPGPHLHERGVR